MESAFHESVPPAKAPGAGLFPGAVSVSHCTVYDSRAPDGLHGGSPHVHFTCAEGYVVLEGSGSVQTLSSRGYREVQIEPLAVVWFEPGVIHRLVNSGDLRILVVMQNRGLPEAGDAVFAFPLEVVRDRARYVEAACAATEEAVRARRDLAVLGFDALRNDPSQLDAFYSAALRIVADDLDGWEALWGSGAAAAAQRTGEIIGRLRDGDVSVLRDGGVFSAGAAAQARLGMCGHLAVVDWESAG